MNTVSYVNTFIRISEDSPVTTSKTPELYRGKETVATLEYKLLHDHPYAFTQEDVQFQTHLLKKDISTTDEKTLATLRTEFFSKPKACFRASPLPKKYGWGLHYDGAGKIAIYGAETEAYTRFLADENLQQLKGMKSRR